MGLSGLQAKKRLTQRGVSLFQPRKAPNGDSATVVVDYLKGSTLIDSPAKVHLLTTLDFHSEVNEQTGELTEWPKRCQYANLKLVIVPAKFRGWYWLEVSGSIHKFWEGTTNWQKFPYSDVCTTIQSVSNLCRVTSQEIKIKQIEFGVNLISPPLETPIILSHLIEMRNQSFSPMRTKGYKSIGSDLSLTDFDMKLYHKSAQYGLHVDVCRVEVHVRKHVDRMFGVSTLADLTNWDNMHRVGKRLAKLVGDITFDDKTANLECLTPSQRDLLIKGRNPRNLTDMSRIERCRFRKLIKEHGTLKIGSRLANLVDNEWERLLES